MRSLFKHSPAKYLCLLLQGWLVAGCCVFAGEVPAFVNESIYSSNTAVVSVVESTYAADLVVLEGGLENGLRLGMVCRVLRDTKLVGELIIIESRSDRSAGLILSLTDGFILRAGDVAHVKTLQNS